MAVQYASVRVRKERGVMVVQGMGKTSKGQTYVKAAIRLTATSMSDPQFKAEMKTAVEKLYL